MFISNDERQETGHRLESLEKSVAKLAEHTGTTYVKGLDGKRVDVMRNFSQLTIPEQIKRLHTRASDGDSDQRRNVKRIEMLEENVISLYEHVVRTQEYARKQAQLDRDFNALLAHLGLEVVDIEAHRKLRKVKA
jgi:hypothetical protein